VKTYVVINRCKGGLFYLVGGKTTGETRCNKCEYVSQGTRDFRNNLSDCELSRIYEGHSNTILPLMKEIPE